MRIGITVQHQDARIVAGWILRSTDDSDNKLYVNIIDDIYVIVQARIRRYGT